MKYHLLALTLVISHPFAVSAQSSSNHAVGARSICSLSDAGALSCATDNAFTRLQPPADTPALTTIVAGDVHLCGLTEEGTAVCWGDNSFGQNNVPEEERFISLSAGVNNTCGVTIDNRALCWGLDTHGETEPPVDDLFTQVASDLTNSCGLQIDGSMACWGQQDLSDYLDDGYFFTQLAIKDEDVCGLTDDNTIRCRFESTAPAGVDFVDVAMTRSLVCGLHISGDISCTTNDISENWGPYLEARIAEINAGPDLVSLHGGAGVTRMCYETVDGDFDCLVRENAAAPILPGDMTDVSSAPVVLADVYSDTTVELSWTQSNATTGGADIYRNGELLATTSNGSSYIDDTMTPGVEYDYSVATFSFNGVRSDISDPITVNAAPGTGDGTDSGYSPVYRPLEPQGLTFQIYSANTLELFWDRPDSLTDNFYGYEIRRNHQFHAFTTGVSFFDTVVTGESYHYDVVAVSRDGRILGFAGIDVE